MKPFTLHLQNTLTMASSSSSSLALILLALTPFIFFITEAQKAPAPAPEGPLNITGILDKAGQYTSFIRLLTTTQVASQLENTLNSSDQGLTVLAPTDSAFSNLKAGTLNSLSTQEQVALVLYHVLPKYYTLAMFQTVSNPVRTQATGQDGGEYSLNFTTSTNQVNVSTGIVDTQINTVLNKDFPLAMYQLDKVLLPKDLFGPKAPKASPAPPPATPADKPKKSPAAAGPAKSKTADSDSGSNKMNAGLAGLMVVIGSMCMGLF